MSQNSLAPAQKKDDRVFQGETHHLKKKFVHSTNIKENRSHDINIVSQSKYRIWHGSSYHSGDGGGGTLVQESTICPFCKASF